MIKEDVRIIHKSNEIKVIVFFMLVGLLIYSMYYNDKEQGNYLKSFKGEKIGLLTRVKDHDEHGYTLQYYFYLDKKIRATIYVKEYDSEILNKFFKVKYNINNPEENYIVLEEELEPDSISLVKAGFTKTKYYVYDAGVTCKYIEKTKWK
ncbi:hypothetical protein IRZ71_00710 [Flavobacterium sp. ANB]|uniref:hypothetical protein n=1 Tax=unclassified Flavobacterium TaxID=196869 RepID=UPI0012B96F38|nr:MULTISPECIES: hypothetical protein [unclassified Flavobacterium]MBF4514842.1 hypothetical protein [Flavobacterium sp. ANB]MTD68168.1 hypothetical protein [Flavobacterium sp. LC2016-13]